MGDDEPFQEGTRRLEVESNALSGSVATAHLHSLIELRVSGTGDPERSKHGYLQRVERVVKFSVQFDY